VTSDDTLASTTTAVVLCGGAGRRFGGDKTRALLDGVPVLDRVVGGLPGGWTVVCVGAQRPTVRPVAWCREEPPGGGPVAALAAAFPHVSSDVVVVLGGDMPYAAGSAPGLVDRLRAEPDAEGVVARDGDGRLQPLLAAYRTAALRAAVPEPAAGTPLMALLDRIRTVVVPLAEPATLDVDTPADLDRASHRLDP
jgi:molybdopterin-guanine dinucleotide biosynthesis protein A